MYLILRSVRTPPVAWAKTKRSSTWVSKSNLDPRNIVLLHLNGENRMRFRSVVKCSLSRSSFVNMSATLSEPGIFLTLPLFFCTFSRTALSRS